MAEMVLDVALEVKAKLDVCFGDFDKAIGSQTPRAVTNEGGTAQVEPTGQCPS